MGLTIHYSGKLRKPSDLHLLIREAIDNADSMHWNHQYIPSLPDIPVEGVLITPEGSEPLWLTFHRDGFMCNPLLYSFVLQAEGRGIPADAVQGLFTKTQYAGVETHMALIKLLRYLSRKYFDRFELYDESNYWETDDESICRQRFGEYDKILNLVGNALDEIDFDAKESPENIVRKIERMLEDRFGMKKKE